MMYEDCIIDLNAASLLVGLTEGELLREVLAGRLNVSTSISNLLAWRSTPTGLVTSGPPPSQSANAPAAQPSSALGAISQVIGPFTKAASLTHIWPDLSHEVYPTVYIADIQVDGRPNVIYVALTSRTSAGMSDRARATVFCEHPPKERALVEFSGNGTLATVTIYACPIKHRGSQAQLRPDEPVPSEYESLPRDIFSRIVRGPYASNAVAVIADATDLNTMLTIMATHGIIRGVYKGWL